MCWRVSHKFDRTGAALADGHYSRRTVGSPQFMPPGQTLVMVGDDRGAVFGWWRPHPDAGLRALNGLDGWTCTIFRRVSGPVASAMILRAEQELGLRFGWLGCGPDGLLTYVWDSKVASTNPRILLQARRVARCRPPGLLRENAPAERRRPQDSAAQGVCAGRCQMIRLCGYATCLALIYIAPGAADTNRCHAHQGMANEPETDAQRIERVRAMFGWGRAR